MHDVRGQLLEKCRNGAAVRYAYDAAGNRIQKTEDKKETRYRYNQKNQLLQKEDADGISCFTYDRQGGIIEEKTAAVIHCFTYNSLHQQTQVETETGKIQKNRYDAEGLRYELIENSRRTSFVYHNGELLHEKGEKAGLSKEATSYHLGAGIEAFRRDRKTFYYHQDEQLNTTLISDEERKLRNHYQYDAFGAGLEAVETVPNRIRYTGQQYDEQTEQYYLRARYYNPVLGRFMQEDVYQGDGLNLYAYCANNPVVYYDPSGYNQDNLIGSMSYEDILELLYQRSDERFIDKLIKKGVSDIKLLPTELKVMFFNEGKQKDNLTPHHMPSADSVKKLEKMNSDFAACIHMLSYTHSYTFTYKMSSTSRPLDYQLYNAISYEDRLKFDQYDCMRIYAYSRENINFDVMEYIMNEKYKLSMNMRDLNDALKLYGESDIKILEIIKEDDC